MWLKTGPFPSIMEESVSGRNRLLLVIVSGGKSYRKDNVCAPTLGHTFNVNSNEEVAAGTLPLPTL